MEMLTNKDEIKYSGSLKLTRIRNDNNNDSSRCQCSFSSSMDTSFFRLFNTRKAVEPVMLIF